MSNESNSEDVGGESQSQAPNQAASSAGAPQGKNRRPSSLIKDRGIRFVNKMRNVGYLAGYSAPGDGQSFLLQQNNNIEHALRIQVNPKHVDVRRVAGRPLLLMVHVRGYRDERDGPQLAIHCIEIDKPSILDLPVDDMWVSGFGGKSTTGKDAAKILNKLGKDGFSPFDANGEIRPEFREHIAHADSSTGEFELDSKAQAFVTAYKMFGDVLAASGGVIDSRLDRGQNYISVAGFVDHKAYVPETQHRKGYGLIMLRQQRDQEANIPVRVTGSKAQLYIKNLSEGQAILVEGSIRRKVIPNDAGEIVSAHTYIETPRVAAAILDQDILNPIPVWWSEIRERLVAARQERRAATQTVNSTDRAKRIAKPIPVLNAAAVEDLSEGL
jgi:hypothetical protein